MAGRLIDERIKPWIQETLWTPNRINTTNIKKTHYSKAVKNETKSREKLIILSNKQKQDCQLTNRNKLEDNATFQSNERK